MLTFHAKASSKTSAKQKPSVAYKYGPLFVHTAIASRFREALNQVLIRTTEYPNR